MTFSSELGVVASFLSVKTWSNVGSSCTGTLCLCAGYWAASKAHFKVCGRASANGCSYGEFVCSFEKKRIQIYTVFSILDKDYL